MSRTRGTEQLEWPCLSCTSECLLDHLKPCSIGASMERRLRRSHEVNTTPNTGSCSPGNISGDAWEFVRPMRTADTPIPNWIIFARPHAFFKNCAFSSQGRDGLVPGTVQYTPFLSICILQPLCDEERNRRPGRATEWASRRSRHHGELRKERMELFTGLGGSRAWSARENRCLERLQGASPERGTPPRVKRTECPRTRWPRRAPRREKRASSLPHGASPSVAAWPLKPSAVLGGGERGGGVPPRVSWSGPVVLRLDAEVGRAPRGAAGAAEPLRSGPCGWAKRLFLARCRRSAATARG